MALSHVSSVNSRRLLIITRSCDGLVTKIYCRSSIPFLVALSVLRVFLIIKFIYTAMTFFGEFRAKV